MINTPLYIILYPPDIGCKNKNYKQVITAQRIEQYNAIFVAELYSGKILKNLCRGNIDYGYKRFVFVEIQNEKTARVILSCIDTRTYPVCCAFSDCILDLTGNAIFKNRYGPQTYPIKEFTWKQII